jgi:hypothetical protein
MANTRQLGYSKACGLWMTYADRCTQRGKQNSQHQYFAQYTGHSFLSQLVTGNETLVQDFVPEYM